MEKFFFAEGGTFNVFFGISRQLFPNITDEIKQSKGQWAVFWGIVTENDPAKFRFPTLQTHRAKVIPVKMEPFPGKDHF